MQIGRAVPAIVVNPDSTVDRMMVDRRIISVATPPPNVGSVDMQRAGRSLDGKWNVFAPDGWTLKHLTVAQRFFANSAHIDIVAITRERMTAMLDTEAERLPVGAALVDTREWRADGFGGEEELRIERLYAIPPDIFP